MEDIQYIPRITARAGHHKKKVKKSKQYFIRVRKEI